MSSTAKPAKAAAFSDVVPPRATDMSIVERACAKINLTLEIAGRRQDGYHHLKSLVAFAADIADVVRLTPGPVGSTVVTGSTSSALDGPNIVDRVVDDLVSTDPDLRLGRFEIEKHIPVAAGLGGGSADAAAALRAIARANEIADIERYFAGQAAKLGADIPVCLGDGSATAAMMAGIGEVVWRPSGEALIPPDVYALLVNPMRPLATAEVFRRLAAAPLVGTAVETPVRAPLRSLDALVGYMESAPNDLEPPARKIEPSIDTVLAAIAAQAGCRIARMSGSGATCCGIFSDRSKADLALATISSAQPGWWVKTTRLV